MSGGSWYALKELRFGADKDSVELRTVAGEMSGLDHVPEDPAVFSAIANLAEVFGLQLVAVGVETEEQLSHLHRTEGSLGQGYYFARFR